MSRTPVDFITVKNKGTTFIASTEKNEFKKLVANGVLSAEFLKAVEKVEADLPKDIPNVGARIIASIQNRAATVESTTVLPSLPDVQVTLTRRF